MPNIQGMFKAGGFARRFRLRRQGGIHDGKVADHSERHRISLGKRNFKEQNLDAGVHQFVVFFLEPWLAGRLHRELLQEGPILQLDRRIPIRGMFYYLLAGDRCFTFVFLVNR